MGRWKRQMVISIILGCASFATTKQPPEYDPVVSHFKFLRQAEGIYRQQQQSPHIVCTYTYVIRGSEIYNVGYSCKNM